MENNRSFIEVHAGANGPICDFCSSPDKPQFAYGCQNFVSEAVGKFLGLAVSGSNGGWCACLPCKQLIDADKWEELAVRSASKFARLNPELADLYPITLAYVRKLHQEFRQMRGATQ